jgi:hypothetical protein
MRRYLVLLLCICFVGCSSANLDFVKEHGEEKWKSIGWTPVGYEGFEWGMLGVFGYGGAKVWWVLKQTPDNGITYSGYLQRWGNELHVYGPRAIDAIKP